MEGDLDIVALGADNEIGSELSLAYVLPPAEAEAYYEIQPAGTEINTVADSFSAVSSLPAEEYNTSLSFGDTQDGFYTQVQTDQAGTITVYGNGTISTGYDSMAIQTVTAALNQVTTGWYTAVAANS